MAVSITQGGQTITAEHGTALSLLYLRELLADSEMWKALVADPDAKWTTAKALADAASSSRTNALAAIYLDRLPSGVSSTAATALIRPLNEMDIERMALATFDVSGIFLLTIELPIPLDYRDDDTINVAMIDFHNKIGRIINEIKVLIPASERLDITRIRRGPSGELDPDDNNGARVRGIELLVYYDGEH